MSPNLNVLSQAGFGFDHAVIDGLITTSREAMALSTDLLGQGEHELAAHWARFAEFLIASEAYLGPVLSQGV